MVRHAATAPATAAASKPAIAPRTPLLLTTWLCVMHGAIGSAFAQEFPYPPDTDAPASEAGEPVPAPAPTPTPAETEAPKEPAVGLRLEAQIVAALSLPFAGEPGAAAFGFGLTYGVGWGTIPLLIGIDFMSIGRTSEATSALGADGDTVLLPVKRTTSDRLLDFDLWLRVQPPRWPVRPYAEAFIGAKLVQTQYSLATGDAEATKGSDHDWARALGWGAGVDFMGLFNPVAAFSLTLAVRRLHGTQLELERPVLVEGRGRIRRQSLPSDETIFMAGLCGRFEYPAD